MIRLRTAWLCLSLLVTLACAVRIACADEPQRPVKIYANGAALVSADFINLLLARGVKQTTDVAEELMGAYTVGQVQTRGRITADLVPNRHGGIVDVCLRGRAEAPQNTAYKGSVTVVSSSQTSIDARKRMLVDARGLRMLPAVATCRTSIEVQDVSAGGPIIERFARRRVDRLQSEAEQDASQRAQQRIAAELDREAQGPLEQAQAAFLQKVRQPALECDAFPQHVQVSTTDKHLYLKLLHQRSGQHRSR